MTHRVKVLATKHGDASTVSGSQMMEGENGLPLVVLCHAPPSKQDLESKIL